MQENNSSLFRVATPSGEWLLFNELMYIEVLIYTEKEEDLSYEKV